MIELIPEIKTILFMASFENPNVIWHYIKWYYYIRIVSSTIFKKNDSSPKFSDTDREFPEVFQ